MKVYVVSMEEDSCRRVSSVFTNMDDALREFREGFLGYKNESGAKNEDIGWDCGGGQWCWFAYDECYGMTVTEKELR